MAADAEAAQLADSLRQATQAIGSLTSTVSRSDNTFSSYNNTITQSTNAIAGIAAAFGPLGKVAGALVQGLGAAAKAVAAQNDVYLKSFDTLSNFGAQIGATADGMGKLFNSTQITQANLLQFTQSLEQVGSDLTLLGNGVLGGAKGFAKLTELTSEQELQYRKLGITQDKYNKYAADYIKTQASLGVSNLKDIDKTRAGTDRYLTTLNELTAVTGEQRDSIAAQQKQLALDVQFQARQRELRAQGDEGIKRADKEMAIVSALTAKGGKDVGAAAKEVAIFGKTMGTQTSQTAVLFGGQLEKSITGYVEGNEKLGESLQNIGKAGERGMGQFNQAIKFGGSQVLGVTGELGEGIGKLASTSTDVSESNIDAQKKQQDKVAEADVARQRFERTSQSAMESFVNVLADKINPLFTQLAKTLEASILALSKWSKTIWQTITEKTGEIIDKASAKIFDWTGGRAGKKPAQAQAGTEAQSQADGRGVQQRAANDQTVASGKQTDKYGNLNIKPGATGGGGVDEKVVQLTQKAVDEFSKQGISKVIITALNDKFHKDLGRRSKHTEGKAVDLTVDPAPKDAAQAEVMAKVLKELGFNKVIDEYFHPSPGATGGHFHAELAKGGITNGISIAGEKGPEAVVPLPDGRTIPVKITKDETDQSADIKALMSSLASNDSSKLMENLMTTMGDKLDTMIGYLKSSADHQEDLLINARNS